MLNSCVVGGRRALQGFGDTASTQRAQLLDKAGLTSVMASFAPGGSWPQKLAAGYAAARASLVKYTSTLTYDPAAAEDVFFQIDAWQQSHQALIADMMTRPATDTLPEQVVFTFGVDKAKQFIVASFATAARGLGPWLSGIVSSDYKTDPRLTQDFVTADADDRLAVFAGIVKMDRDGDLGRIFQVGEDWKKSVAGFGGAPLIPIIWALVTLVVASLAVFLIYTYSMKSLLLSNKIMEEKCNEATATGNPVAIELCKKFLEDQQPTVDKLGSTAIKYAAGIALLYVAVVHVAPKLLSKGAHV